jgi:hypothetical protein
MPYIGPPAPPNAAQEPFWQPLGRIVFTFGHLETQIDWCISALLDTHGTQGEPSVASQIRNICSRIALVEALFRQLTADEHQRTQLHGLVKELRVLLKFRNGVLHGPWGTYLEERRTWQKPRTDPFHLGPGFFEVSLEEVNEKIERAAETGNALVQLVRRLADERAARAVPAP